MTYLTRRAMLKAGAAGGAGALVLASALPIVVAPGADWAALSAVARWRHAWARALAIETFLRDNPELDRNPAVIAPDLTWPRRRALFEDARSRLLKAEPRTLQGALAVLDCAATVIDCRDQARRDDRDGTLARRLTCYGAQGEDRMVLIAHRALRRLLPEA
jgi:hypothetical protein